MSDTMTTTDTQLLNALRNVVSSLKFTTEIIAIVRTESDRLSD